MQLILVSFNLYYQSFIFLQSLDLFMMIYLFLRSSKSACRSITSSFFMELPLIVLNRYLAYFILQTYFSKYIHHQYQIFLFIFYISNRIFQLCIKFGNIMIRIIYFFIFFTQLYLSYPSILCYFVFIFSYNYYISSYKTFIVLINCQIKLYAKDNSLFSSQPYFFYCYVYKILILFCSSYTFIFNKVDALLVEFKMDFEKLLQLLAMKFIKIMLKILLHTKFKEFIISQYIVFEKIIQIQNVFYKDQIQIAKQLLLTFQNQALLMKLQLIQPY
ncbi:unnamed protein product (macronuclear) [Paramecium tetraurelia]|uniref:Transmembrane protein n=1 Tax=Paramecium tetraurelia TaxID=5888 RepID=A0C4Z3_PARTE|nr:uncharacterized protein GSPATT00006359001 [Paramecium tetraurelia]CAK65860.1 unnamed protein product [Paramecium tetraurelia]|eukprot:XP_001433257.1 hypothetical protein (macronuclear) [Paramecium tetraurelia strain d4-2]